MPIRRLLRKFTSKMIMRTYSNILHVVSEKLPARGIAVEVFDEYLEFPIENLQVIELDAASD